jgi:hypothetical protein
MANSWIPPIRGTLQAASAQTELPAVAIATTGSVPPTNWLDQRQPQVQVHRTLGRHFFTGAR